MIAFPQRAFSLDGLAQHSAKALALAASGKEATSKASAMPGRVKASSFPTMLDALFEEPLSREKSREKSDGQGSTPSEDAASFTVAIAPDPALPRTHPMIAGNFAWEAKAPGAEPPDGIISSKDSTIDRGTPGGPTPRRPVVSLPVVTPPTSIEVESSQAPFSVPADLSGEAEGFDVQESIASGRAADSLTEPSTAAPARMPYYRSKTAASPQLQSDSDLVPPQDYGFAPTATSTPGPDFVPMVPHLLPHPDASSDLSDKHTAKHTASTLRESRETSDALVSERASLFAPSDIQPPPTPVAGPNAQPDTRPANPKSAAGLESSATVRLVGDTATDRPLDRQAAAARIPEARIPEAAATARDGKQDAPQPVPGADTENQLSDAELAFSGPAELAFSGRLAPVPASDMRGRSDRPDSHPDRAAQSFRYASLSDLTGASPDSASENAVTAIAAVGLTAGQSNGNSQQGATPGGRGDSDPLDRERKPEIAHAGDAEVASAGVSSTLVAPLHALEGRVANLSGHSRGEPAPPPEIAQQPETQTAKAPATPRDIRLEVNSGDQRVEVHLVERAGDVHVSVRTPDTHLAGELRENLPALSSRLEQTGFHAEEWHATPPASGEWRQRMEHSAGSNTSDSNGQPGQHAHEKQGDPEGRHPKVQEQLNRKEKGKEFAWFMSSLH